MTTASLHLRRLPRSPAAPPLDDDDLIAEILLRLPPQPSSLPRASLVCSRWRRLASDPGFHRRFRIHHRRSPPLLGYMHANQGIAFQPALDAPDRLPRGHFSLKLDDRFMTLGWRHGLALFFLPISLQVVVWDPVAGVQHRLAVLPEFEFDSVERAIFGAVLRAAGDVDHFRVVLPSWQAGTGSNLEVRSPAFTRRRPAYGGDSISAPLPSGAMVPVWGEPAVLAGDCIYWLISASNILEFDLDRQSLAVTLVPAHVLTSGNRHVTVMRAEGGGMAGWVASSCQASPPNYGGGRQTVMVLFHGTVEELLNWTIYFPQIQRKSHRI